MNDLLQYLGIMFIVLLALTSIILVLFSESIFKDTNTQFNYKYISFCVFIIILFIFAFNIGMKYERTKTKETTQSSTIQRETKDCDSLLESTIRSNKIQEENSRNRQK